VNVFDFLLPNGGTTVQDDDEEEEEAWESEDDMQLERLPDITAFLEQDPYDLDGFVYGSAPINSSNVRYASHPDLMPPPNDFVTPGHKGHSRNMSLDSTGQKKSDKKRKRTHLEDLDLSMSMPPNGDVVMTDTPTVLHSGLTGGINRMLARPEFPPSPDLSGGDANGNGSPKSPIKRTRREKESSSRHDREHRREKKAKRKSDADEGRHRSTKSSRTREEPGSKRDKTAGSSNAGRWERRRSRKRSASPVFGRALSPQPHPTPHLSSALKAIEYPNYGPSNAEPTASNALVQFGSSSIIEHQPTTQTVDMFLACLVKGSETEEGVSLWRALKRWRRDGGNTTGGGEKELWKGLKVRVNDEGEMVLCV
jgi:cell growth-regulating nucleolar protein